MAKLSSAERSALPDSAFGYVEPGHAVNGKTPDKFRHFPVHDAAHVRDAFSRGGQGARFWDKAKAKVMAAAKKFGVQHDEGSETGRSLESLYPEMRFLYSAPELEFRDGDSGDSIPHITGYAAVFSKEDGSPALSRRLGGFQEIVDKRAFNAAAEEGFSGVVCRYNHRDDMVLGTTRGGTLKLDVNERGLKYDVNPPRSRGDVLELVQRGDVRYSSFAFRCNEPGVDDEWGVTPYNYPLRTLHNVELVDVAPVLDPAYFDTSAAARSMIGAVESLARWVDAEPDEVRSYLAAGQAIKFFKRSDRTSPVPAREIVSSEIRVMDDQAVALRNWKYDPDVLTEANPDAPATPEVTEEQNANLEETEVRTPRSEEEIRAAVKPRTTDQLCMRYHHGEPCVRPSGHPADGPHAEEGGHAGLCWGRQDGMPCNQHEGHDGDHTPITVASRDGSEAENALEETRQEIPDYELFEAQAKMDEIRAQIAAEGTS